MKIRAGFVSNSSSSSFCIFGAMLSSEDLIAGVTRLVESGEITPKNSYWKDDAYECGQLLSMEFYSSEYDDDVWIGMSWPKIGDDETGRQFKDRVITAIKKALPDIPDRAFDTYEEVFPN